jgi:hypothetical protein
MKIEFITDDWSQQIHDENGHEEIGGAGWIRMDMVRLALQKRGHQCVIGRGVITFDGMLRCQDRETMGVSTERPDIIIVQRLMGEEVLHAMKQCQMNGIKIIQDVDDAHFNIPPDNAAFWGSHPKNNPKANRSIYVDILKKSDRLVVSTPLLLKEYAVRSGRPTTLIRNTLDMSMWPKPDFEAIHNRLPVTVGWVGATPWRVRDIKLLAGILGPWAERTGTHIHHSGAITGGYQFNELAGLSERVNYTQQPMSIMKTYPALFKPLQVSLVPLTMSQFNDAKSYLKGGLESVASGLPYIASPTAEYRYLYEEYGVGRLATKPKEWFRHLDALLDKETRIEEAVRQWEVLQDYGNVERAVILYEDMLERVISQPRLVW